MEAENWVMSWGLMVSWAKDAADKPVMERGWDTGLVLTGDSTLWVRLFDGFWCWDRRCFEEAFLWDVFLSKPGFLRSSKISSSTIRKRNQDIQSYNATRHHCTCTVCCPHQLSHHKYCYGFCCLHSGCASGPEFASLSLKAQTSRTRN